MSQPRSRDRRAIAFLRAARRTISPARCSRRPAMLAGLLAAVILASGCQSRTAPSETPQASSPAAPAATAVAPDDAPPLDFAALTKRLNDIQRWHVVRGSWEGRDGKLIGSGDNLLTFRDRLPGTFTLEFKMNVVQGIRPRVRFQGFHVGNEGPQQELFLHRLKAQGRGLVYQHDAELSLRVVVQAERVQLEINGQRVAEAPCAARPYQGLSLSGGDAWSKGKTEFYDFRLGPP